MVPSSVMGEFPPLPDWAIGVKGEKAVRGEEVKSELGSSSGSKKRERDVTIDESVTRDVSPHVRLVNYLKAWRHCKLTRRAAHHRQSLIRLHRINDSEATSPPIML